MVAHVLRERERERERDKLLANFVGFGRNIAEIDCLGNMAMSVIVLLFDQIWRTEEH